jgi:hypothetical protein
MRRIKEIAEQFSHEFGSHVFASARIFSSWETDEVICIFTRQIILVSVIFFILFFLQVIMEELYRNLAIAMVCVFVTTFILIANMFACVLVLLCVVLTLVKSTLIKSYLFNMKLTVFLFFSFQDMCERNYALLGSYNRHCILHQFGIGDWTLRRLRCPCCSHFHD